MPFSLLPRIGCWHQECALLEERQVDWTESTPVGVPDQLRAVLPDVVLRGCAFGLPDRASDPCASIDLHVRLEAVGEPIWRDRQASWVEVHRGRVGFGYFVPDVGWSCHDEVAIQVEARVWTDSGSIDRRFAGEVAFPASWRHGFRLLLRDDERGSLTLHTSRDGWTGGFNQDGLRLLPVEPIDWLEPRPPPPPVRSRGRRHGSHPRTWNRRMGETH